MRGGEQLDYEIQRYLDGEMTPEQRLGLEARLANDPDARILLAEYRRLYDGLEQAFAVPPVDYESLRAAVCDSIAAEARPARLRIGRAASALVAVAAAALIGLGIWRGIRPDPPSLQPQTTAVAIVEGPRVEPAAGPAVVEIAPPSMARDGENWYALEPLVTGRTFIDIVATSAAPVQDNPMH